MGPDVRTKCAMGPGAKISYPLASYLLCKGKILPLGKQLRAHKDMGSPLQSGASSLWWGRLGWWLTGWGLPGWGKRLRSPSLQSQGHTNPSLDLRLTEWSSDFKGLGCQLLAWRPQEEGAEKQAVWLVLVSEDTSFWHQVPSYGKDSFYKTALVVLIHLPFHLSSFKR